MSEGFHRQCVILGDAMWLRSLLLPAPHSVNQSILLGLSFLACPALKYLQARENNF